MHKLLNRCLYVSLHLCLYCIRVWFLHSLFACCLSDKSAIFCFINSWHVPVVKFCATSRITESRSTRQSVWPWVWGAGFWYNWHLVSVGCLSMGLMKTVPLLASTSTSTLHCIDNRDMPCSFIVINFMKIHLDKYFSNSSPV